MLQKGFKVDNKITKTGITVIFVMLLLISIIITLHTPDKKLQFDNNLPDSNHLIKKSKMLQKIITVLVSKEMLHQH